MLELDSVHCQHSFSWMVFLSQYAPYNSEKLVWLKYLSNQDVKSIDAKFLREYVKGRLLRTLIICLIRSPFQAKFIYPLNLLKTVTRLCQYPLLWCHPQQSYLTVFLVPADFPIVAVSPVSSVWLRTRDQILPRLTNPALRL